jgi:valyl-tRNA synthetase
MIKPYFYGIYYEYRQDTFNVCKFIFFELGNILRKDFDISGEEYKSLKDTISDIYHQTLNMENSKKDLLVLDTVIEIILSIKELYKSFDIDGLFESGIAKDLYINIISKTNIDNWMNFVGRMVGASKITSLESGMMDDPFVLQYSLKNTIHIKKQTDKLKKMKEKMILESERAQEFLNNIGFMAKAPNEKIEEERQKKIYYDDMIIRINQIEQKIEGFLIR